MRKKGGLKLELLHNDGGRLGVGETMLLVPLIKTYLLFKGTLNFRGTTLMLTGR